MTAAAIALGVLTCAALGTWAVRRYVARRLAALRETEGARATRDVGARLRSIGDHSPFLSGYFDSQETCRYANEGFAALLGLSPQQMRGRHVCELLPPDYYENIRPLLAKALSGEPVQYHRALRMPDGTERQFEVSLVPHRNGAGNVEGFYAMWLDVTSQYLAEAAAAEAKERLSLALEGSGLSLWDLDVASRRIYLDEGWNAILSKPHGPTETTLDELFELVHPDERDALSKAWIDVIKGNAPTYQVEHRVRGAGGEWKWIESRGRVVRRDAEGRALRMAGTNADITGRKAAEQRIRHLATHDALTDLPNRFLLDDRLGRAIAHADRDKHGLILLFVDVDRFKTVNESLGHSAGDDLLRAVAQRLSATIRTEDTLARPGGDEFILLAASARGDMNRHVVAQRVLELIQRPFRVGDHDVHLTASIGVAIYPEDGRDAETLLKNADAAMYSAKEAGRNTIRFFTPSMTEQATTRLDLENRLRVALARNQLSIHYQSQIDLGSSRVIGAEALGRWNEPQYGWISPAKFIPVAEDSGLIVPFGEWILERSCRQAKAWQDEGLADFSVSVNVSVRQFRDPNFIARVRSILSDTRLPPTSLELEITESVLMHNVEETIAALRALNELGVRLAIDDFGTGYSSLSYLKRLPIHRLKIDQSFVRDIADDPNDAVIVAATIAMAHNLGLSVIAEGVETQIQAEFLRKHGCDEVQGYYFARPLPPEECAFRPPQIGVA